MIFVTKILENGWILVLVLVLLIGVKIGYMDKDIRQLKAEKVSIVPTPVIPPKSIKSHNNMPTITPKPEER